jgi:signal transduction histidine kinase
VLSAFVPATAAEQKNILVLHSVSRDTKPWSEYAKAIRQELELQSPWSLSIRDQSLVSPQPGDSRTEPALVEFLDALYASTPLDLIISIGAPAAAFIQRHRSELFPTVPMVFTIVDQRRVQHEALGPKDVVVPVAIDYRAAIDNILTVLPDTTQIAVVVGTSPIEVFWRKEIAHTAEAFKDRVNFLWYDTFSFNDILKHAAKASSNTAIFWELMIVDAAGTMHDDGTALSKLYAVANAPIFSYTDAFFGREIVGGPHVPVAEAGREVGAVAVRLLGGEPPETIKVAPVGMDSPKFDWRELKRWGISESRLPAGSTVYFRDPTFWEQYRYYSVAIVLAVLLQSGIIGWLLFEHRRRRIAEIFARSTMAELQNVNRLAAAGELSASIAHEVKQPLTVIVSNAYAALNWLSADRLNVVETRNSLDRIVTATHRASDIISGVRAMFARDDHKRDLVDINDLILSVLAIAQLSLRRHAIDLETQLGERLPLIRGHRVQLQQVLLNLVLNAIEAMERSPSKNLCIRSTRTSSGGVCVAVQDTGIGVAPGDIDRVFRPLYTTKPKGMGMGLSICRSIVEAHGGHIAVYSVPSGGSVFQFDLPAESGDA